MNPRWQKMLKDYTEALLVALVLALFIRTFVVQAFKIPSGSMLETLQIGDQLLVSKFIYGIKIPFTNTIAIPITDPERGDVVVFEYPENPSVDYIKRIVGTPGDVLELRDSVLYVNGQAQEEDYVAKHMGRSRNILQQRFGPITVPEGKYFVMGDNRNNSHDSRYWGKKAMNYGADLSAVNEYTFVPRGAIVGKAWRIYWSWKTKLNWKSSGYSTDWSQFPPVRFDRLGHLIE